MTTNIKFSEQESDFLKRFSIERTGKKNIAGAIRIILMERMNKNCKCLNAIEVISPQHLKQ
jgi:hypothetical protein